MILVILIIFTLISNSPLTSLIVVVQMEEYIQKNTLC